MIARFLATLTPDLAKNVRHSRSVVGFMERFIRSKPSRPYAVGAISMIGIG